MNHLFPYGDVEQRLVGELLTVFALAAVSTAAVPAGANDMVEATGLVSVSEGPAPLIVFTGPAVTSQQGPVRN